jgi:hypothetical protein
LKTELKDGRFLLSGSPLRALFQDRDPGLLTMFDKFSYSNGRSPFGLKIKKDGTEAIGDLVFAMRNTEDFLVENAKDAEVFEERWPQSYALKTPSPLSYALRCLYLDVFGEIQPRITY